MSSKEMKLVKKDYRISLEFDYPELGFPSEETHRRYRDRMENFVHEVRGYFANEGYTCKYGIESKDSRD